MATYNAENVSDLSFAERVKGLAVDPRVAAWTIASSTAADRCLVVIFTPRSGSTWLTRIVSATRKLGDLEEYINPEFVRGVAETMHATDQATLLAMLKRWTKSQNGVFSIEARSTDIVLFGEGVFFESFSANTRTEIFFLWRDNIVAQGISLYRAVTTGRFHSADPPTALPAYDAESICEWMAHIVSIENDNLLLLQRYNRHARFLRYEDVVRDRCTTLRIIADAVKVGLTNEELAVSGRDEPKRIADDWNRLTETRFRAEWRDYIWDLEARRLIRRAGVAT
jgi:trehalose 2-sulfotransferase